MLDPPCFLLGLPQELLFSAVDYIDGKRDLYNLSRTCRALEDVCLRRLYHDVTLDPCEPRPTCSDLLRSHVVDVVSGLAVYNGPTHTRRRAKSRSQCSYPSAFDQKLSHMLQGFPLNKLGSFSSYHNSPTSQELLEILASRQNQSLQRLRMFELSPSLAPNVILPNRLKAFDCCSVGDGKVVRDLIRMNRMTLQQLSLGQEKDLLLQYAQPGLGMLALASSSNILGPAMLTDIPNLQELELTGLDISTLLPLSMEDVAPLCNLTKLSLQSCSGADQFLGVLGALFASVQSASPSPQQTNPQPVVHLKHFLLRTEAPTADLKRAIILFLASFTGLETLSLLFENGSVLERVSTLLGEHGPTLRTLCLEARIQPRDKLGLDTSRAFGSGGYSQELWERSMHEICQLCPNLVELGFSFPWDDELVRLRKTPLPALAQLKTIHIRNFPENRALSQVGDYTIKEYAQKFVDWVFPTLGGGQRPPLEFLAIGPSLYEGRMRMSDTKPQLPEFKRTHFFGVDWAMTRFSKWSFMVSPISERYLEEIRDERPLKGIFEQVWLR